MNATHLGLLRVAHVDLIEGGPPSPLDLLGLRVPITAADATARAVTVSCEILTRTELRARIVDASGDAAGARFDVARIVYEASGWSGIAIDDQRRTLALPYGGDAGRFIVLTIPI